MALSATVADRSPSAKRSLLTRDKVIERVRRWEALYGEPPGTADWNPSVARWRAQEWRVARYRLGDPETGEPWPSTTAAKRRFGGSWDAAVRAAGFVPRRSGPRPAGAPAHLHVVPLSADGAARSHPDAPPRDADGALDELGARSPAARAGGSAAAGPGGAAPGASATGAQDTDPFADGLPRPLPARPRGGDPLARQLEAERRRGERVREELTAARARAKRSAEQARRAKAARAREAQRRLAAEADAAELRGRLAALETTRGGGTVSLPGGLAGPAVLAEALTALAVARRAGDPVRLAAALGAVERAAAGWRERL